MPGLPSPVPVKAGECHLCNYTASRQRSVAFKTTLLNLRIKRHLDLWSPALCYCGLAAGRIEAIINDGIELYDFAAGKLIATESGAKVTDFQGVPLEVDTDNTFLITNGTPIHEFLVEEVTRPLAHV